MQQKTPSKPIPTSASLETLVAHYNSQLDEYNAAVGKITGSMSRVPEYLQPMQPISIDRFHNYPEGSPEREEERMRVVDLIRRQNRKLGKTIRRRALALLEERIKGPDGRPMTDDDGRSIGLKYDEVLKIIQGEFPEASTSVACLRWYVVHLRMDANDLGLPWPDLPQIRPRSKSRSKAQEEMQEAA